MRTSALLVSLVLLAALVPSAAAQTFERATYTTSLCPNGYVYDLDPFRGGSCWSCPTGTTRTIYPVTRSLACEIPAQTEFAQADDRGAPTSRSPLLPRTDCPRGAFLDIGRGRCYSCPSGFDRTAEAVTSPRACSRTVEARTVSASQPFDDRYRRDVTCPSGSFFDPIEDGSCWSCPPGFTRTASAVDGPRACERPDDRR